jgi:hypothetical protein
MYCVSVSHDFLFVCFLKNQAIFLKKNIKTDNHEELTRVLGQYRHYRRHAHQHPTAGMRGWVGMVLCVCVRVYMYVDMYVYTYVYTCVCVCVCVCVCICIYMYICIIGAMLTTHPHTHTHTHTHTCRAFPKVRSMVILYRKCTRVMNFEIFRSSSPL